MRKFTNKKFCALLLAIMLLGGCASGEKEKLPTPGQTMQDNSEPTGISLPEKLEISADGTPVLSVYQVDEEEMREMDMESYLLGVLAGEMKNDWPMEALKAQAILARTFVLKFCTEKESKYAGADISTDIEEAQAYDATGVNERIEQAVQETRGMILSYNNELPYAWFHAHSGGVTSRAEEGLNYKGGDAGYTQVTEGKESDQAPEDARQWEAEFSGEEMLQALNSMGVKEINEIEAIAIGETGESGRATTLLINGQSVNAPDLRIALGPSKMRSTLLTGLKMQDGNIYMEGKGYGHGVGMPQWGAYGMAESGKTAEEIVSYYFQDVKVEKIW
ncbi:MAG: SpoIID/LytB domain-containing protein [Clostridiales bacterium]|nr:SpoIID/LytB domain-containing protein [Clostridiales bacterium]